VDRGHRGGAGVGSESIPDRACEHYDPEDDVSISVLFLVMSELPASSSSTKEKGKQDDEESTHPAAQNSRDRLPRAGSRQTRRVSAAFPCVSASQKKQRKLPEFFLKKKFFLKIE
jgi:hypothetical protein